MHRDVLKQVRLTAAEAAELARLARLAGKTESAILRSGIQYEATREESMRQRADVFEALARLAEEVPGKKCRLIMAS